MGQIPSFKEHLPNLWFQRYKNYAQLIYNIYYGSIQYLGRLKQESFIFSILPFTIDYYFMLSRAEHENVQYTYVFANGPL